jgi:glycerol-3-phosphate acyltransferase PlsX
MSHPATHSSAGRQTTATADPPVSPLGQTAIRPRIVVDAAGGDGPISTRVAGAVSAARVYTDTDVLLCGVQEEVDREIEKLGPRPGNVISLHAPEQIGMHEPPVQALREKKQSSIAIGIDLVARGEAHAFVSAGNTGAVAAASTLKLGRLKGVQRPGIAAAMQVMDHPLVTIDVGANVDSKPIHLLQHGIMATVFVQQVLGIEHPRVGLLNVGEEAGKGDELTRQAYLLLEKSGLNFVGNVEPGKLINHGCDIAVCDGFIGNIILKLGESLTMKLIDWAREEVKSRLRYVIGFLLCKSLFRHMKHCADFSEYGGAPLLGVNGVTIITHGTSDARAIQNAVREARSFVRHQVNQHIEAAVLADAASRPLKS